MHSRSLLHRLSETPRASAAEVDHAERHPLGFADVRSSEPATTGHTRRAIGFVTESEPRFVTEVSFRRTPTTSVGRGAEVPSPERAVETHVDSPGIAETQGPDVGHAVGIAVGGPYADASGDVPFYKREISLRRRKPEESAVDESAEPGDSNEDAGNGADGPSGPDDASPKPVGFEWPTADVAAEADEEPADASPVEEPVVTEPVASAELPDEEPVSSPEPVVTPDPVVTSDPVAATLVEADEPYDLGDNDELTLDDAEFTLDDPASSDADDLADFDATFAIADAPVDEAELPPAPDLEPLVAVGEPDDPAVDDVSEAPSEEAEKKSRGLVRSGRRVKTAPARTSSKSSRGGRRVVGLKIGASQIAAAVVTQSEDRHELVGLARTPLEPGIVVDGEVRDADALSDALKSFFDEHKLPKKDVRIGVASNRIGVRTFDIAGIDDQERFDNAVRFKAHEVLPVSVHESVLDYRVVDERVAEGGEVIRRVLLVVAPRDQVEPFVGACSAAGIRLGGIDLEALALLRAFVEPQRFALRTSTDTATVVVAIGHESTSLLVSGGGTSEFTRVFDWGGSSLQHAIAQELEITEPEAGELLKALSLSSSTSSLPEEQAARALDAVRARLTPFARELVSSLQFYQAQSESLGIGEIVITGGTSHLEGLADALHQMIGVSVRVGDPLQRVVPMVEISDELHASIGSLAVPIGLAIEDEALRSVNLLPVELRNVGRKRPNLLNVALPVAAVVPFIAFGVLFLNASGDVTDRQGQLETVQAQISALPDPIKPEIDPTLELAEQQRGASLAAVLGTRLAWDRVLVDLSRVLPANVWLTHFNAQAPAYAPVLPAAAVAPPAAPGTPVGTPTPTGVVIEGYTYSLPDVARLLSRLNALPSLENVVLGTTSKIKIGKREAVSFTINADIASTGGAQ